MDLSQWLIASQAIKESELVLQTLNVNSIIFTAYLLVSVLIKRSAFIAAFFISCLLFDAAIFDPLSETSLYLITFAIYSYVIFAIQRNNAAYVACGILITLSLVLAYDAYFYGMDGVYGARKTFVYNNIEYLALYAHTIFICSLTPYRRIKNGIRSFIGSIMRISHNSAYIVIC